MCSTGICCDGLLCHLDLVSGGIRTGVPRAQLSSQRFAGLIAVGEHRVKPVAALEVPSRALLLRMRPDQGGIQVDRQTLRGARQLPHARPCLRVSLVQPVQALRVTGDPINEPERRRGRRDIPEQRLLITERPQIGQAVPAIGEHHREVTDHATQVMPGSTLLEVHEPQRQGACQPSLLGDLGEQRAAHVRDQTLSVRHNIYRETAAIALHPQGDPPELGNKVFDNPNSPSSAGHPRAPASRGRGR